MECFRLLFDHLAWIEYQFLSGTRDSRKAGSLWGLMRCVGGVRKSIHRSWLAKGLGLGLGQSNYVEVLREFSKRFRRKRPALFKSGQWHFHQGNAPVNNSILVTDYLNKMGLKTVPHTPYSQDLGPCDFWLFPKLRGCRYETIEEKKEAVTKVIDTLEAEQNCNILTPTLMDITAFLSRSPGLLNREPRGPASLGYVLHSSVFSPTNLNFSCSIGGPEGSLCWVLVFSTASYLQLTDFLSSPGLYNCSTSTFFLCASQIALIQPIHGQGYILIFLDRMHLLFKQVHFLFRQLGRGQYVTPSPKLVAIIREKSYINHRWRKKFQSVLIIYKIQITSFRIWTLVAK